MEDIFIMLSKVYTKGLQSYKCSKQRNDFYFCFGF